MRRARDRYVVFAWRLVAVLALSVVSVADRGCVEADDDASRSAYRDRPDQPAEAAKQRLLQSLDDEGTVAAGAILRAIDAHQASRLRARVDGKTARMATGPRNGLTPLTAGAEPSRWVWLGPGDIGGRTRSIVIHPKRPSTIWLGSVGGGIWNSTDGGQTWFPVDDFMASIAVSCMAVDPTSPDVMLAGTGEGFYNGDALPGAGIFRSTLKNGRIGWERLAGTDTDDFRFVTRLSISADGSAWVAATHAGALLNPTVKARGGLYLRTPTDPAWTLVSDASPSGTIETFYDVCFNPTDKLVGLASSEIYFSSKREYQTRVYRTKDAGRHWSIVAGIPEDVGRVELCFATADPSVAYASADRAGFDSTAGDYLGGGQIYRSDDGGSTFNPRGTNLRGSSPAQRVLYLQGQGWYANAVWAGDPSDKNVVVVGGLDLWRSADGGETLEQISDWTKSGDGASISPHADHHAITSDGAGTVYFGNDGGVYRTMSIRTVNAISGWERRNNRLGVTQGFGVAVDPTSGECLLGTQDNGTLLLSDLSGAGRWTTIRGGDGGCCGSDGDALLGEYTFLALHRRSRGDSFATSIYGGMWAQAPNGQWAHVAIPGSSPIGDALTQQSNFVAPFVVDPNRKNRVLAGGVSLWRTDDAGAPAAEYAPPPIPQGPHWAQIKPPIAVTPNKYEHSISAIAIASGDSDLVWVGHNNGALFRTENATSAAPVWVAVVGGTTHPPTRYCTRIVIDPRDKKRVFALYGGYVPGNILLTEDGGQNWIKLFDRPDLPAAPVRALAIHPQNSEFLYAGTELGVYASEDGGKTWSASNEGPTSCSVEDLVWVGTTLIASTHGRGVYKIDLGIKPPIPELFAPLSAPMLPAVREQQKQDRQREGLERDR